MQFAQHPQPGLRSIEKQVGLSCGSYEVVIVEDWLFACCTFDGFIMIYPSQLFSSILNQTNKLHPELCRVYLESSQDASEDRTEAVLHRFAETRPYASGLKWKANRNLSQRFLKGHGTSKKKRGCFSHMTHFLGGVSVFFVADIFHLEHFGAGSRWRNLPLDKFCRLPMYWDGKIRWIEYERIKVATIIYIVIRFR